MANEQSKATTESQGPAGHWQQALRDGKLLIQRCTDCAKHVFYPRRLCPHCHSASLLWVDADGRAAVHATTVVARPASKGGDYNVAIVELVEGVRMMSRVEELPADAVRIGMDVCAKVLNAPDGPIVVFVPADAR